VILIKTLKTAPAHTPVKKKVNAASVLPITNQEMKFQAVSSAQQQKQNMTVQLNISSVHLPNKTNTLKSASFEGKLSTWPFLYIYLRNFNYKKKSALATKINITLNNFKI